MRQIPLIFVKDLRHLWPNVVVLNLLVAAHAVFDVLSQPLQLEKLQRVNSIANLLTIVLACAISFLVAQAVQEESLPGDRQFWLTRPYWRRDLVAAKLLFLASFISLPLFVSDCYILASQALPVAPVLPELVLRQGMIALIFILPSFALATVTQGLAQFLLGWFIAFLALIGEMALEFHNAIGFSTPFSISVLPLVAFAAVIVWQYTVRRTLPARLTLAGVTCGFLPFISLLQSFSPAGSQQVSLPPQAKGFDIRIGYDLQRKINWSDIQRYPRADAVYLRIPLSVSGLPPDTLLRGHGQLTILRDRKPVLKSVIAWGVSLDRIDGSYWQTMSIERNLLKAVTNAPVDLHTWWTSLEVVTDKVTDHIDTKNAVLFETNLGICRTYDDLGSEAMSCKKGLEPRVGAAVADHGVLLGESARVGIPWGLSPTSTTFADRWNPGSDGTELMVIPRRRLGEFQRSLELSGVDLNKYSAIP